MNYALNYAMNFFKHSGSGRSKGKQILHFNWLIFWPAKGAGNDAWCAFISNTKQYIQLDFMRNTCVTRIVTYGRRQKSHWVKRYKIQFSSDEVIWHNYTENGFVKVGINYHKDQNITNLDVFSFRSFQLWYFLGTWLL